jgi:hypothetical protein
MKPMMQLSHLVVCMLNSSWSKKRVEATELPKHRNTSVARQNSGHRLSPHFPLHGMYPAQQTYLQDRGAGEWIQGGLTQCSYLTIASRRK